MSKPKSFISPQLIVDKLVELNHPIFTLESIKKVTYIAENANYQLMTLDEIISSFNGLYFCLKEVRNLYPNPAKPSANKEGENKK